MKKHRIALLLMLVLLQIWGMEAFATDEAKVIEQLEQIDSLQEMQNKRAEYAVRSRYNVLTTDDSIITAHETARTEYESYIQKMFAARVAAQQAYDQLTEEQKAGIDSALVEKLDTTLDTNFKGGTFTITPSNNEYTYEAVKGIEKGGLAYEVSNHITVSPQIPATFILIDTSGDETTWSPNGRYEYGKSNYDLTYCCDVRTFLSYGTHYKRVNLEDSNYYGENSAKHIRAILQSSYPFITLEEMKENLKVGGLKEEYVDQLTRADVIAAVQMAVWAYANTDESDIANDSRYGSTYDVTKNATVYLNPLHDYTNEIWDWWTTSSKMYSYDARAEYRVNTLVYYLCNLEGVEAADDQIVISDIQIARAELIESAEETYQVGMYVYLNNGGSQQDALTISVTSYHENEDGSIGVTSKNSQKLEGRDIVELSVKAGVQDTIQVVVEGTQNLGKGVYFYEPEGGRDVSQSLVGVASGKTKVRTEESFVFTKDVEKGLRIYKTDGLTGLPISDITFHVYAVKSGEISGELPTIEEVERYAVEENKVCSVVTDSTGYASAALENGTYLVVEEQNPDKVKEPVAPFYIQVPMIVEEERADGSIQLQTYEIVSVYPKNTLVEPPEEPPVIPPTPDTVKGKFTIIKHDKADDTILLKGAEFQVYRAAVQNEENTTIVRVNGVEYAVVPVEIDGEALILTTDENGCVTSPNLTCGTYFLEEIAAPAGYNCLEEAVIVTVVPDVLGETETIYIANERGAILPETGGMGTTIFWASGMLLMLGSAVALITKRKY